MNGDVFIPALWVTDFAILAYSTEGYKQRNWELPEEWSDYKAVDLYKLTLYGTKTFKQNILLKENKITLSLNAGEAVLVVPWQSQPILYGR